MSPSPASEGMPPAQPGRLGRILLTFGRVVSAVARGFNYLLLAGGAVGVVWGLVTWNGARIGWSLLTILLGSIGLALTTADTDR